MTEINESFSEKYCPACRTTIPGDAVVCTGCGARWVRDRSEPLKAGVTLAAGFLGGAYLMSAGLNLTGGLVIFLIGCAGGLVIKLWLAGRIGKGRWVF